MPGELIALLGIEVPIIQAPIGNAATPALAAAVSNAGGLGMLSLSWSDAAQIRRLIQAARVGSPRPFGVNLVLEWSQQERLHVALSEGIKIVSTFWGNPAEYASMVHVAGGVLIHTVGSLDDAATAVAAGADIIVVQGIEAGGHVRGVMPLQQLLAQIKAAFPSTPLIAAGGIADARDVAAVRAAGAAGAWLGTRFVCSVEANAAEVYQQMIIGADAADTVVTTLFSRGWPDAPHRVLRNSTVRASEKNGQGAMATSASADIVAYTERGIPIERYAFALPTKTMTGDLEAMALYAGHSVERIRDVRPASDLVRCLAAVA
jgi:NAD(P)H-dependent flavin oxidoreductase YrpB (nitropropane dioxygenase family)